MIIKSSLDNLYSKKYWPTFAVLLRLAIASLLWYLKGVVIFYFVTFDIAQTYHSAIQYYGYLFFIPLVYLADRIYKMKLTYAKTIYIVLIAVLLAIHMLYLVPIFIFGYLIHILF